MGQSLVLETDKSDINPFDQKGTIKVMTSEPSSGYVDCQVYDNRIDFYMALARLEQISNFKFFSGNCGRMPVNYARERMCDEAIRQGMDYILMMDDDQIVPKTLFERLFKVMDEKKADIVAPMVTQRLHPFNPVIYRHAAAGEGKLSNEFIHDYEPNSIVKADGVGFGVVLLKVDTLKRIKTPRFFSNTEIGEDIWFCIKARAEANAQIYVDTSIKTGHLRPPEMATEYDWVKAKNLDDKFKPIYGHIPSKEYLIDKFNEAANQGR